MSEWLVTALALIPLLSALAGALGYLIMFRVQSRQAGAQETTAGAAGRKALADELDARTREWQALLTTANSQVATAQNLTTAVDARNERLNIDIAGLTAKLEQHTVTAQAKQLFTEVKLQECEALNRAIVMRMEELERGQAINGKRLGNLEAGRVVEAVREASDPRSGSG